MFTANLIFFHEKQNDYIANYKNIQPEFYGVKMAKPKYKTVDTMEPPFLHESVKCQNWVLFSLPTSQNVL